VKIVVPTFGSLVPICMVSPGRVEGTRIMRSGPLAANPEPRAAGQKR